MVNNDHGTPKLTLEAVAGSDENPGILGTVFIQVEHGAGVMVSGGGLAVCAASLLRFWTVAVSKNSSRAPDRPLSLSLTIERIFLASPNSASIFFR